MRKNEKKDRIYIVIFGLIILLVSLYALYETRLRLNLIKENNLVIAQIYDLTYGKGTKTIYINIDRKKINAGESFDYYNNKVIGDTIQVYYSSKLNFAVLKGKNLRNSLVAEYFFVSLGLFLILIGIIYPLLPHESFYLIKAKLDGTIDKIKGKTNIK